MQERINTSEQAVEKARAKRLQLKQDFSAIQSDLKSLQQRLEENIKSGQRQQKELNALEKQRSDAEERMQKAHNSLKEAEASLQEKRDAFAQTEKSIESLRKNSDEQKDGLAELRLDLASKKQFLDGLKKGLNEQQQQDKALEKRIQHRAMEIGSLKTQIAELNNTAHTQREQREGLENQIRVATEALHSCQQNLSARESKIAELEHSLQDLRSTQRKQQDQLKTQEVKLAQEQSQAQFIVDKVESDYQVSIERVDWKQELWKADEEFETKGKLDELDEDVQPRVKHKREQPNADDLAAMESTDWKTVDDEIADLRIRITGLGAINLVAIEEYAELKERYDFLTEQSEDLWNSKNDIIKAIDDLNETSLKLFQDTFEQVRKNFSYTFTELFGGGLAKLELIEAEDVLDSGIEITARPPGTKLQTLSLLSGGQRTMTAVALLFAIYMVKPSPFAVLDELDAPLDDANIGRFTKMLSEFTKYSQFLVITHNKRTVAAANSIYGVTMQERGVSKLLSMRFSEA